MAWAPDYVALTAVAPTPSLKSYLVHGGITDVVDDTELAMFITASSRAIDDHCNRQFGVLAAPQLRTYKAWPDYDRGQWVVDIDDLMTAAGLVVDVAGVVTTEFTKEPVNAAAETRPWTRLAFDRTAAVRPTVDNNYAVNVTATFGWTAIPVSVIQATLLQCSRFNARRDSPYGIAGSPDQGSELRLLAKLDPDVAVSLRGFVRPRRAG